ncbi:MAG: LPS export ABC transporter permease LptG [Candidatus Krumholzibacteria bacterium]|nr:LPS export ABC transporter permease LptG [Candidatus Krumholzibacteria bacterium]
MITRIHDKYLLKQFLKVFALSVIAFVVIYVTVDTFEEIDNFIDHNAKIRHIVLYYVYSLPFILTYIIPVSLLLGTVFSMGILARRNEITAFISSGVSLVRVAQPILLLAMMVSMASAVFNDVVVTRANRRQKDIKRYDIEGRTRSDPRLKENFHYLGENGFVYLASRYNHENRTLYEVVVQQFDENTLVRRVDAKRAVWKHGAWLFSSGFDRVFQSKSEQVQAFRELKIPELQEDPESFAKREVDQENMNARELTSYIDKVRKSGGSTERYTTDLYFKFSYPLAGSIFVLIGIAFASGKRKQSMATGFGVTLLISFIYYGVLRVGQTLGYNGVVPPFLAAQLGNLIFLTVGVGLLSRANQ